MAEQVLSSPKYGYKKFKKSYEGTIFGSFPKRGDPNMDPFIGTPPKSTPTLGKPLLVTMLASTLSHVAP